MIEVEFTYQGRRVYHTRRASSGCALYVEFSESSSRAEVVGGLLDVGGAIRAADTPGERENLREHFAGALAQGLMALGVRIAGEEAP